MEAAKAQNWAVEPREKSTPSSEPFTTAFLNLWSANMRQVVPRQTYEFNSNSIKFIEIKKVKIKYMTENCSNKINTVRRQTL
jgi:hypothetical protein